MIDLSIIIVSFNTKDLTVQCLKKLNESLEKEALRYEIIVVDNGSIDGSVNTIKNLKLKIKNFIFIENKNNLGFGAANNVGLKRAQGKFILFLNSDVMIDKISWKNILEYMQNNPNIGALTTKVILSNGKLDMACHRGFPTIWRSFTYFSKLEKLVGSLPVLSTVFGGYHLLNKDLNTTHEIDSPTGAFFLSRYDVLSKIKGFDEDYFMYGEDLDL
ncbi:MAG TPA: glycosyltransferase family 2 protein, partial [Candidatus Nitrosocosmicus sp.]|nr:glycosyltransferase family 2 protein [Candidatus Nitrosocosmicus sp.]